METTKTIIVSYGTNSTKSLLSRQSIIKGNMNGETEVKNRIRLKAEEMFSQFGFSKVTMEEIAAELCISKKTLYKYFSNKEHVLKEVIGEVKCEITTFVDELLADKTMEFIDKINKLMSFLAMHIAKIDGPLVRDLMKNHPEMWSDIQKFRREKTHANFSRLIQEGIERGFFRKDIPAQLIVMMYDSAMQGLLNRDALSELPFTSDQIHREVNKVVFEGILSDKGREKFRTTNFEIEN